MKHLMYLSISILCLSVSLLIGFHLGVKSAKAETVDPTPPGSILAVTDTNAGHLYVRTTSGEVWDLDSNASWQPLPSIPLPVPISAVAYWTNQLVITTSDEGFAIVNGAWVSAGPVPGATSGVNVEPTTWGKLKSQYKEDKQGEQQ